MLPEAPFNGVTVIVQFGAVPVTEIPLEGSSSEFDENAIILLQVSESSTSLNTKLSSGSAALEAVRSFMFQVEVVSFNATSPGVLTWPMEGTSFTAEMLKLIVTFAVQSGVALSSQIL